MIKWLSNLLTRSRQVKNEQVDLANTAIRVGSLLEDLAQSGVFPYDATNAYKAGQYVVFGGGLAYAVADTVAGESPGSAPLKWSLQLVTDPAQVTLSNKLPISASAVRAVINQASNGGDSQSGNATETARGLARQATSEEVIEGVVNDAYTTPKHLHDQIEAVNALVVGLTLPLSFADATALASQLSVFFANLTLPVRLPYNQADSISAVKRIGDRNYIVEIDFGKTLELLAQNAPASTLNYAGLQILRNGTDDLFTLICAGLTRIGCVTGAGTGSVNTTTFNPADLETLADYFWNYTAYKEQWLISADGNTSVPKPAPPTLTTIAPVVPVVLTPVINSVQGKYEPNTIGYTAQANCSNGSDFRTRLVGVDGTSWPYTNWYLADLFAGDAANGSYSFRFEESERNILPGGNYRADWRVGIDNTAIKSQYFTVAVAAPIPLDDYQIDGLTVQPETVTGYTYKIQQKYSNGSWADLAASTFRQWVLINAPSGLGIGPTNGVLSGGADLISADTPFTIRCFIGKNIELGVLLKNTVNGSVPPPVTLIIAGVFTQTADGVGRIGLANTSAAAEVHRVVKKLVSGLEEPVYESPWYAGDIIGGAYGPGGATVQKVWGYDNQAVPGATMSPGTYRAYETWRPVGAGPNDINQYVALPAYSIVIGAAPVLPYIISILHQYNPGNLTDYFLVKHSVIENDTTKLPVWRCKRTEENAWRGSFVGLYSTEGQYAQFNQGYRLFMQANLTTQGVNQTNGTFQFKPYPDAPDSAIIEIKIAHNSSTPQDYGTEVYAATTPWGYDESDETDTSFYTFTGTYE